MLARDDRAVSRCNARHQHGTCDAMLGEERGKHLWGEGVFWVAVRCVQKHSVAALEALEVGIVKQVRPKSHVPAVDVGFPCWQLEEDLGCSGAVVGIH